MAIRIPENPRTAHSSERLVWDALVRQLAGYLRGRWIVENRLHRVRDVNFWRRCVSDPDGGGRG